MMTPDPDRKTLRLGIDGRVLDDRYHGIGRITYELVDRWADQPGWTITLFLNRTQRSERFQLDRLTSRPSVRVVYFDQQLTSARQFVKWPGALRRADVDVALFPYHLGASLFGAKTRFSIVHDCIFEENSRFAPDTRTRLLYLMLTTVVVRRTKIVTPSQASADAVERYHHVSVPPSHVVQWGVGTTFGSDAEPLASINGRPIPRRYLLHVGARRPHKNVEQLVRVLARLRPDEHLVLVGSTDDRWPDNTAELARELQVSDRIIQLSGVSEPELLGLYRQATAFLYPSLVEGFGLPLLEAMAAGVPVIASDIPVFRELVAASAVLVPHDDTSRWVAAVRDLDDPAHREAMIAGGLERAQMANWDEAAGRMATVLRAG